MMGRMKSRFEWFSLPDIARFLIPYAVVLIGLILSLVKIPLPLMDLVRPDVLLILVYFWAIYRPTFFSPAKIFVVGVLYDLLVGSYIGLSSILLLLFYVLVKGQRRFLMAQNFMVQWLCFALVAAAKMGVEWGLISLFMWDVTGIIKMALVMGLTVTLFPFFSLLLIQVNKLMETL